MEGEREGVQGCNPWKPRKEAQRECNSQAARSFSTPQGVTRQERVHNPSTSPKDGAGTPSSMPKTSRSQQRPTESANSRPQEPTNYPSHTSGASAEQHTTQGITT